MESTFSLGLENFAPTHPGSLLKTPGLLLRKPQDIPEFFFAASIPTGFQIGPEFHLPVACKRKIFGCLCYPDTPMPKSPTLPNLGIRPNSCAHFLLNRKIRLIASKRWTGIRIVRACSAIERLIDWRIPPSGIGAKFITSPGVKFINRSDQTQVSLLN